MQGDEPVEQDVFLRVLLRELGGELRATRTVNSELARALSQVSHGMLLLQTEITELRRAVRELAEVVRVRQRSPTLTPPVDTEVVDVPLPRTITNR